MELILAYKKLTFQIEEKEKHMAELITANKKLAFQNVEKEKRTAELLVANKELDYQIEENDKCTKELIIINKKLDNQYEEKEKRMAELIIVTEELEKALESQKEYIKSLEEMISMISHKVRQPIAHILGLSNLLDQFIYSPSRMSKLVDYIKESALTLDSFTMELTLFIHTQKKKYLLKK